MAKLQILCTRDQAGGIYNQPFCAPSVGIAMRSFADETNRAAADNMVYLHPEDFTLWHLGEYDDYTAQFALFERPVQLAIARDLATKVPQTKSHSFAEVGGNGQ